MDSTPIVRSRPRRRRPFRVAAGLLLCLALGACGEPDAPSSSPSSKGASRPTRRARPYDARGRARDPGIIPEQLPNLVLLVIDTLRDDALQRRTAEGVSTDMPALLGVAASGIRVAHATTPASWTLPAVTSMLTGLYPSEHGLDVPQNTRSLPGSVRTYAEIMSATYGYETAAFVDGPWFGAGADTMQGFGTQQTSFGLRASEDVLTPWIRARDPKRPFFLLLHTLEAHDPYGARNHPFPPGLSSIPEGPLSRVPHTSTDPWALTRAYFLDARARAAMAERGRKHVQAVLGCMNRRGAEHPDPESLREIEEGYFEGTRWVDGRTRVYARPSGSQRHLREHPARHRIGPR